MDVETVTTSDRSLLRAVRGTLDGAAEPLLCVAFVQPRGLHLVGKEPRALAARRARPRLLVTTTFEANPQAALGLAHSFGVEVRVLNPGSGSTYHPKLYLGSRGEQAQAVVGSANLTGRPRHQHRGRGVDGRPAARRPHRSGLGLGRVAVAGPAGPGMVGGRGRRGGRGAGARAAGVHLGGDAAGPGVPDSRDECGEPGHGGHALGGARRDRPVARSHRRPCVHPRLDVQPRLGRAAGARGALEPDAPRRPAHPPLQRRLRHFDATPPVEVVSGRRIALRWKGTR